MDKATQKKIKDLEKQGFKVQKVVATTKKTFEVPIELLESFMKYVKDNDIRVKYAIAEALELYLSSRVK